MRNEEGTDWNEAEKMDRWHCNFWLQKRQLWLLCTENWTLESKVTLPALVTTRQSPLWKRRGSSSKFLRLFCVRYNLGRLHIIALPQVIRRKKTTSLDPDLSPSWFSQRIYIHPIHRERNLWRWNYLPVSAQWWKRWFLESADGAVTSFFQLWAGKP